LITIWIIIEGEVLVLLLTLTLPKQNLLYIKEQIIEVSNKLKQLADKNILELLEPKS
jgi:hypothetical protein